MPSVQSERQMVAMIDRGRAALAVFGLAYLPVEEEEALRYRK
jgi:hypothetical protein